MPLPLPCRYLGPRAGVSLNRFTPRLPGRSSALCTSHRQPAARPAGTPRPRPQPWGPLTALVPETQGTAHHPEGHSQPTSRRPSPASNTTQHNTIPPTPPPTTHTEAGGCEPGSSNHWLRADALHLIHFRFCGKPPEAQVRKKAAGQESGVAPTLRQGRRGALGRTR